MLGGELMLKGWVIADAHCHCGAELVALDVKSYENNPPCIFGVCPEHGSVKAINYRMSDPEFAEVS